MATDEVIRFFPKPLSTGQLAVLNGFIFQKRRINGKWTKFVCLRSKMNVCESVLMICDYNERNESYTSFHLKNEHCHSPTARENELPSDKVTPKIGPSEPIPFRIKWLIEDRKQILRQRLRDQMRRDNDIIRNRRKFNQVVGSFPDGGFEKLQRGNNAILKMVADNIEDLSDITSACMMSSSFEELLGERRQMSIVPKVLGILSEGDYINREKETGLKVFVDDTFFQPEFKTLNEGNWSKWFCNPDTSFLDVSVVERFLETEAPDESHYSRFRSIEVRRSSFSRNPAAFFERLEGLLNIYGHHVWALKYEDWTNAYDDVKMNRFKQVARKTLSLRSLEICIYGDSDRNNRRQNPEELNPIPFPLLSSLVHLKVWCDETNNNGLMEILRNCPNLKSLQLIQPEIKHDNSIFQLLRNLRLERCSFTLNRTGLGIYPHLINCDWPINILDLTMWQSQIRVGSSELFRCLNRFRNTLEEIEMNFHIVKDGDEYLQLPHLKVLMMSELDRDTIRMEDLIQLVSLKTLVLKTYTHGDNSTGDFSDFTSSFTDEENENEYVIVESVRALFGAEGEEDDDEKIEESILPSMFEFGKKVDDNIKSIEFTVSTLEKSNIWDCFPCLEEVKIECVAVFVRRNGTVERKQYQPV